MPTSPPPGPPAEPKGGGEGLGQDEEDDVEVDVKVDGAGQGVGEECLDDLGEPLLDGHPAGVVRDKGLGGDLGVVGDDGGGLIAAQAVMTGCGTVPRWLVSLPACRSRTREATASRV